MSLPKNQTERFARLYALLVEFAEIELKVRMPVPGALAARDAMHEKPRVIDKFVRTNPASLSDNDLQIVAKWKNAVTGFFYLLEHKTGSSLFMGTDLDGNPIDIVYSVSGLTERLVRPFCKRLPVYVSTVLLPFDGKIVFNGHLGWSPAKIREEERQSMLERLKYVKNTTGIVTSLESDVSSKSKPRKR